MKIYLDSNVFIYAILDRGQFGDNARSVLRIMEEGKFSGVTSFTSFEETLFVVFREKGRIDALRAGKAFLALHNIEEFGFSKESMLIAIDCMEKQGLLPRDAMHLAAMRSKGINFILSEDKDFDSIEGVKRYTLASFLKKVS